MCTTPYFNRVKWMEDIAEKSAAAGGNAAAVRSTIRWQAGLTEEEDATLKAVVAEWWKALAALRGEVQTRGGAGAGPPDPQQRWDYMSSHKRITEEAVERLKARLGAARFAQLNGFVHATSNVKAVQVARPPSSRQGGSEPREAP